MLRETISNEWYTILFVLSLLSITLAKYFYSSRFAEFLTVIGNSKYLKIYVKEQKFVDLFDALLFMNQLIAFSIFGFIAYNQFFVPLDFDILHLLKIGVGIGSILLIKVLLERLIGSLFDIDIIIDQYLFQKINYKNYTGLVLLPINMLLIFSIEPSKNWIYAILILLIIINLIGFTTSFKSYQKLILNNFFYFILYLCALEIAPYIILYKLFS
jgi:hypothetical protein